MEKYFWEYINYVEDLGNLFGLSYELTHILLFVILQPSIIVILLIFLIREKIKNKRIQDINNEQKTPFFLEIIWRISRIFSILVLVFEIFLIYSFFTNQILSPLFVINELKLFTKIIVFCTPPIILILLNFLVFGKLSVWINKI